jgi:addiction module HigA family antidote
MAKAAKAVEVTHPHPGEILASEFLEPRGISPDILAKAIDVPARRIKEVLAGKRGIAADTDLRLARYLGVSEGFFMALQGDFDLAACRREIAKGLKAIVPRKA